MCPGHDVGVGGTGILPAAAAHGRGVIPQDLPSIDSFGLDSFVPDDGGRGSGRLGAWSPDRGAGGDTACGGGPDGFGLLTIGGAVCAADPDLELELGLDLELNLDLGLDLGPELELELGGVLHAPAEAMAVAPGCQACPPDPHEFQFQQVPGSPEAEADPMGLMELDATGGWPGATSAELLKCLDLPGLGGLAPATARDGDLWPELELGLAELRPGSADHCVPSVPGW